MATIADELPFDATPARRPSLDDVGGAVMADKPSAPPEQSGKNVSAKMLNRWQELIAALGRVAPSAILYVRFVAGEPTLDTLIAPGTVLAPGDFTIADEGMGITSIRWFGTKLPTPATCMLTLHDLVGTRTGSASLLINYDPDDDLGAHAMWVTTKVGSSGAAADVDFTVAIY